MLRHARYHVPGLKTPHSGGNTSSEGQKPSRLSPTMTICATSSAHEPTSSCKGHHTLLPYDVHTPTESHWPIKPPSLQPVHMRTTYASVLLTPAPGRRLKIHGHERCEGPITASASNIMFHELADTKIDQTPMPTTTTRPLGASDMSQGYQP